MTVSLTTPAGQVVEGPTLADLSQALDEVLVGGDEEIDLWLEHDEGWTLSVVPTGDVFFENPDEDEEAYWTLGPLPKPEILILLQELCENKLDALRAHPWEEGE